MLPVGAPSLTKLQLRSLACSKVYLVFKSYVCIDLQKVFLNPILAIGIVRIYALSDRYIVFYKRNDDIKSMYMHAQDLRSWSLGMALNVCGIVSVCECV
jgi:hypothetical protein